MRRLKMTDAQLVSHIEMLEQQANNNDSSSVAAAQAKAMDYYLGRPFGTEEEGRSAVISSDVWDVVEGMTPMVLKPFVSSDDIVRFNPEGPEDEEAADQESDYINYVVTQKNDVFETLVSWVKTGLLQKNGIVKYWWEKSKRKRIERYTGLADDVYTALLDDDSIEVVEHTETQGDSVLDQQTGQMMPGEVSHDVVLRVVEESGEPRYCVVPPEEFRISRNATSVNPKKAGFCEHVTRVTLSELREMGFDVEDGINDSGTEDPRFSEQYTARWAQDGDQVSGVEGSDASTREVIFREVYLLVDFDGDGIAELRKVCIVGREILLNEETEEVPFVAWTPYPQPFRFDGRCPADETTEIQLIKSTVLRQTMDNIYTINNNTRYVSSKVNLDDMLDNQIAGIVRVDSDIVGNHVMPAPITPIGNITMPMVEYFDTAKENRTGWTRYNQGADADSLNKTATGVRIISEAGNERVGLVSRCFAEQGLKPLMIGIHGLCRRNADKEQMVRLRGKWVNVDPRGWRNRYDMSVSVGLGSSDKQMQMQGAQLLLDVQMKLAGSGIVEPKNVYEAGAKLAQALGEKNPDKYFTAPPDETPAAPDPTQDPKFQFDMAKLKLDSDKLELENRKFEAQKAKDEGDLAIRAQDLQIRDRDSQIAAGAKAAELQMREGEISSQQGLAREQFERSVTDKESAAALEQEPVNQTLDAIKALAEAMMGAQQVLAKMIEGAQAPRTLRVRKEADGTYTGVQQGAQEE